jgi:hypothetical protein
LDGKARRTNFTEDDLQRTRLIAHLLHDWGLVDIKSPTIDVNSTTDVVVISYAEKPNWSLKAKYTIGKKK